MRRFLFENGLSLQQGSNESKQLDSVGLESDQKQRLGSSAPRNAPRWAKARGLRRVVYENSLVLAMTGSSY